MGEYAGMETTHLKGGSLKRPCSKRRYGCVGYVVPERVWKRETDGTRHEVLAMICNKCGQAHGPA